MTKKQTVLQNITVAIAAGDTATALRLYCENRISRSDFDDAVTRGQTHARKSQEK